MARRAGLTPFEYAESRSLAASRVRARGNAEARAAGRGSSPGCEQIPLILWPFREPAYSSRCSGATFPSDLTCSGPRLWRTGRSLPGECILRRVSPERNASAPLNGSADEVGTERKRPRTPCKCGFRKVLLLSSRELIFSCLLDSSSWLRGDFFPLLSSTDGKVSE